MSHWLVSVPNESNRSSETTFLELKAETASSRHNYAACYRVELPAELLVGTLDSLMALSDELQRVDMILESVVRKIERQFQELHDQDQTLTVDGVPVNRYLEYFQWDEAKHPHRRPLSEIVSIIQSSLGKVEDELKQLSTRYSEKKQMLSQLQRKKSGNLLVANLNDILTPDIVSAEDFVNSDYLQTLVVVIPKNLESQWLSEYQTIGDSIAEYGPEGSRGSVRGSPVVPSSTRKIYDEGDSILYTVTLLKGQYQRGHVNSSGTFEQGTSFDYIEDFKARAREKRYIARDFVFDPSYHASNEEALSQLEVEVDRLRFGLIRWCKAHFGEAFIAWMHVKIIRVFVESVLRYGLPVNFTVILYQPHNGKEKKLRGYLNKRYGHLQPKEFSGADESNSGAAQEYFPYVTNSFTPLSAQT